MCEYVRVGVCRCVYVSVSVYVSYRMFMYVCVYVKINKHSMMKFD